MSQPQDRVRMVRGFTERKTIHAEHNLPMSILTSDRVGGFSETSTHFFEFVYFLEVEFNFSLTVTLKGMERQ